MTGVVGACWEDIHPNFKNHKIVNKFDCNYTRAIQFNFSQLCWFKNANVRQNLNSLILQAAGIARAIPQYMADDQLFKSLSRIL